MNAAIKTTLRGLRLYKPIRLLMHWHLNRDVLRENRRQLAFYAAFIRPDDVVFDVGANIGRRSEIFARLGACVVAVEPNPDCAWQIEAMFPRSQVTVERAGVGAAPGRAVMHICNDDHMSSLSQDWIARMQGSRLSKYSWQRRIDIEVVTLDNLIARHGEPAFVKIDTEGFEVEVLKGLSRPVRALSFEYNPDFLDAALQCLGLVDRLGGYEFNLSPGETLSFARPQWKTAGEIESILREDEAIRVHNYGDIYARLRHSPT